MKDGAKMGKMAVYVSSFDGYSDLWDTFFQIFSKYWPNCSYPVYLVNNEKEYNNTAIAFMNVIHTGPEKYWFDRTIRSLQMLDEKFVLFMLEDYYISKTINQQVLEDILETMEKQNIFCYRLSTHKLHKKKTIYQPVPTSANYPITLQPAIWNREKLVDILKRINGKTPWDFEYYFDTYNYGRDTKYIPGIVYDNRDILGYQNGVLRGKWIPDTVSYFKKQGIEIDVSKRGILDRRVYAKYRFADKVGGIIPKSMRASVKAILLKMGIKYV